MGLFVYFSQQQMDDVDGSGHMMGIDLLRCSQSSDEFLSLLSPVSLLLTLVGGQTLLATSFSTYFFGGQHLCMHLCICAFQISFSEVYIVEHSVTKMQKQFAGFAFDPGERTSLPTNCLV